MRPTIHARSIGTGGRLLVYSKPSADSRKRIARDFLLSLVREYVSFDVKFSNTTGFSDTFWEGEKQMDAMLLPALAEIAEAVSIQGSVDRRTGRRETFGFVDYWANFRGFEFVIEAKHARFNLRGGTNALLRPYVKERWKKARDQLHSFTRAQLDYLGTKRMLRLSLMVLAVEDRYVTSRRRPLSLTIGKVSALLLALVDQLSPRPDWAALWYLPSSLQALLERPRDFDIRMGKGKTLGIEQCLAVAFISRAYLS